MEIGLFHGEANPADIRLRPAVTIVEGVGQSDGVAADSVVGYTVTATGGDGSSTGLGTPTAVGVAIWDGVGGAAAGVATPTAVAAAYHLVAGSSAGVALATAVIVEVIPAKAITLAGVTVDSYDSGIGPALDQLSGEAGFPNVSGLAQSFTAARRTILTGAAFYLTKYTGSPTGNAYAKLYNITGTSGTNAAPTGVALATSDGYDVSTLTSFTSGIALATFLFSGVNQYAMPAGDYAIAIEYIGGDSSNTISVFEDAFVKTDDGNLAIKFNDGGGYLDDSPLDMAFFVLGDSNVAVSAIVKPGVGSSSGVGTPTAVGAARDAVVGGSADGVATVSGIASSYNQAVGSSAGVATADGVGAEVFDGVGASAGVATVDGVAADIFDGVGASAGVAAVDGIAANYFAAVGSSAGVATALGDAEDIFDGVGASNGVATAAGVSATVSAADAVAAGIATAASDSNPTVGVAGSSTGIGAALGAGAAETLGEGAAAGVAGALSDGNSVFAAVWGAAGLSDAEGDGTNTGSDGSDADTDCGAVCLGEGGSITYGEGNSAGVTGGFFISGAEVAGIGTIQCSSDVTAVGVWIVKAEATSDGVAEALWDGEIVPKPRVLRPLSAYDYITLASGMNRRGFIRRAGG